MNNKIECRVCGNFENNSTYEVQEMMYGLGDKFTYFQCGGCNCLQIMSIPKDLDKYYPSDYYSFSTPSNVNLSTFKKWLRMHRTKYAVFKVGILGNLISKFLPDDILSLLSVIRPTKDTRILDVGCGTGLLLSKLHDCGFKNLLGVDPFIKENIFYDNGLNILKKSIFEIDGEWDIVMLNHSFEHMPDPVDTVKYISNLLVKGGICLIRIPTVSSYAWETYKEYWVQIDAPRHFFLHSIESISELARKSNLIVDQIAYDSTDFQFWASEQYMKQISLWGNPRSYCVDKSNSLFTENEILDFKRRAVELNRTSQGDSAVFYLKKS